MYKKKMARKLILALAVLFLLASRTVHAESSTPQEASPPAPAEATKSEADFDLLDDATHPSVAELAEKGAQTDKEVWLRRKMLNVHQALGLGLLASMVATTVVGELNLVDKYGEKGYTRRYYNLHTGLVITTSVLFTSVGTLGYFAPDPYPKKLRFDRLDPSTVHKVSMAAATVGMLAQLALGIVAANLDGSLAQPNLVTAHQIVGFTTLGALTVGAVAWLF